MVLTVVLPCYNEKENVDLLIKEFYEADINKQIKRIIFVDDDSPDNTSEHIKLNTYPLEVLCIRRIHRQGLSSAVIEGILLADSKYVAVMDADGQHAPKDLLSMLKICLNENLQLVIGSRFKNLPLNPNHRGWRSRLSSVGNQVSSMLLKQKLTDPLTGFFIIERSTFNQIAPGLQGNGFKILVDILFQLRQKKISIAEFQIEFRNRIYGESKLDINALTDFLDQIIGLFLGKLYPEKFLVFAIVGSLGVGVHFAALSFLLFIFQSNFTFAQAVATLIAMITNFSLNNLITFRRNRLRGAQWLKGLTYFILFCSLGAIANIGMAGYIYAIDKAWWISGLAGIAVGTAFNFMLSKYFVWKK